MTGTMVLTNNSHTHLKIYPKYGQFFRLFHGESVTLDVASHQNIAEFKLQVEPVALPPSEINMNIEVQGGTLIQSSSVVGVTVFLPTFIIRGHEVKIVAVFND